MDILIQNFKLKLMENKENNPIEKTGFMGGFGFIIVTIGAVSVILLVIKFIIM